MKKHQLISVLAAVILTLGSTSLYPYAYGYTRLYRPDTQTTVDIVYDVHKATKTLGHDDMDLFLCDDIKSGLYPTEKVLVDSLEHLNRVHPHDVTVIWEHCPNFIPMHVHLLTYPQRLVINRLHNINFVAADTWRNDYPGCISSLLGGDSLANRINRGAIIANSGEQTWEQYQSLMGSTLRRVLTAYAPFRERVPYSRHNDDLYKAHFFAKSPYSELADLEMLSHILSSPHHRIVLFAGGFHGENIADFLRCYAPFEVVHSVIDRNFKEINAQELKLIMQDHGRRPSVPQRGPQKRSNIPSPQRPQPVRKSMGRSCENKKPSYRLKPEISANSSLSDAQRRQLTVGGALVLGGVMASAYYEQKRTPGTEFSTLAKRNLLTTLKYGALPSALLYIYMQNPQHTS